MSFTKSSTQRAFCLLYLVFIAAPILAGADKFFHFLTDWNKYLAPFFIQFVPVDIFMKAVGLVEIAAGILVGLKPKVGGYVVGIWLLGIIVNLIMAGNYYDIALRDLGLAFGAFALAQLGDESEPTTLKH